MIGDESWPIIHHLSLFTNRETLLHRRSSPDAIAYVPVRDGIREFKLTLNATAWSARRPTVVISVLNPAYVVALPGDLDKTFNGSGKVRIGSGFGIDEARAVAVQSDGKLIVAGVSSNDGLRNDFAVVRLDQNGSIDPSFGIGGRAITPIRTNGDDKA